MSSRCAFVWLDDSDSALWKEELDEEKRGEGVGTGLKLGFICLL